MQDKIKSYDANQAAANELCGSSNVVITKAMISDITKECQMLFECKKNFNSRITFFSLQFPNGERRRRLKSS